MKVRVGSKYLYDPTFMDAYAPASKGLKFGDIVEVVNLFGCPKANTMGQCYVRLNGEFRGMVSTNSLVPIPKKEKVI